MPVPRVAEPGRETRWGRTAEVRRRGHAAMGALRVEWEGTSAEVQRLRLPPQTVEKVNSPPADGARCWSSAGTTAGKAGASG